MGECIFLTRTRGGLSDETIPSYYNAGFLIRKFKRVFALFNITIFDEDSREIVGKKKRREWREWREENGEKSREYIDLDT